MVSQIVDAVHARGSFIFLQIAALGRAAHPEALARFDVTDIVSASEIPMTGREDTPRALETHEVEEYVQLFAEAAKNAVHGAGFDGVQIHGANGYLVDQFTQDV